LEVNQVILSRHHLYFRVVDLQQPVLIFGVLLFYAVSIAMLSSADKLTSGWRPWDGQDVQNFTNSAVARLNNNQTADENQYRLLQIYDAKIQVVSGKNYLINFQVGLTDCPKDAECPDDAPTTSTKNYSVLIYSQPWTNIETYTFTEQKRQITTSNMTTRKECPFIFFILLVTYLTF